jgi:hypothetical protein
MQEPHIAGRERLAHALLRHRIAQMDAELVRALRFERDRRHISHA